MTTSISVEAMKEAGDGRAAPDEVVRLYRRAFAEFRTRALWSLRADLAAPTITQALTVADALRAEGDVRARALAIEIETACRAAL